MKLNDIDVNSIPCPHIGKLLSNYVLKSDVNRAVLARKLGVTKTSVYRYAESSTLPVSIVWKLSVALNHNFLLEMGSQLPIEFAIPQVVKLQTELDELRETKQKEVDELQKQLEQLKIELGIYQKIVDKISLST